MASLRYLPWGCTMLRRITCCWPTLEHVAKILDCQAKFKADHFDDVWAHSYMEILQVYRMIHDSISACNSKRPNEIPSCGEEASSPDRIFNRQPFKGKAHCLSTAAHFWPRSSKKNIVVFFPQNESQCVWSLVKLPTAVAAVQQWLCLP